MTGVSAISSIDTVGTSTQFTGSSITSGTPYVIVGNTDGIRPGSMVFGSGIPAGATVAEVNTATVFTLSTVATATIGSVTITIVGVTTDEADLKLLTVNSGWYRDIFSASTTLVYPGSSPFAVPSTQVPTSSAITFTKPVVTPPSYAGISGAILGGVTGTLGSTTSDEVNHAPLRQATWYEALWAFTCTTDAIVGPTLTLYYRKYDVVGFCNVAPSL